MDYTLIRSKRRTLSLEVTKNMRVIVRAPQKCSLKYIEQFVEKHSAWIAAKLAEAAAYSERHPEPDEAQRTECINRAKEIIPQRVAYYGSIMQLSPSGIKITGAEKRFGSCSSKNSLCFSWRLMLYPDEAIDYVVVHELAHIVHKNHGKDFYAFVSSVMPDYKERQLLLR